MINHQELWANLESIARAAKVADSQDSASEAYAAWLENGAKGYTLREAIRHATSGIPLGLPTRQERADRHAGLAFLDDTTDGYAGLDRRHCNARFPQPPEVWQGLEALNRDDRAELRTLARIEGRTLESIYLESCGVHGPDEPSIIPRPSAEPVDCRTREEKHKARARDYASAKRAANRMAAQRAREATERAAAQ